MLEARGFLRFSLSLATCYNFPLALIDLRTLLLGSVLGSCVARPRTTFINHLQRWGSRPSRVPGCLGAVVFLLIVITGKLQSTDSLLLSPRAPPPFAKLRCTKNTLINSDQHRLWMADWLAGAPDHHAYIHCVEWIEKYSRPEKKKYRKK